MDLEKLQKNMALVNVPMIASHNEILLYRLLPNENGKCTQLFCQTIARHMPYPITLLSVGFQYDTWIDEQGEPQKQDYLDMKITPPDQLIKIESAIFHLEDYIYFIGMSLNPQLDQREITKSIGTQIVDDFIRIIMLNAARAYDAYYLPDMNFMGLSQEERHELCITLPSL